MMEKKGQSTQTSRVVSSAARRDNLEATITIHSGFGYQFAKGVDGTAGKISAAIIKKRYFTILITPRVPGTLLPDLNDSGEERPQIDTNNNSVHIGNENVITFWYVSQTRAAEGSWDEVVQKKPELFYIFNETSRATFTRQEWKFENMAFRFSPREVDPAGEDTTSHNVPWGMFVQFRQKKLAKKEIAVLSSTNVLGLFVVEIADKSLISTGGKRGPKSRKKQQQKDGGIPPDGEGGNVLIHRIWIASSIDVIPMDTAIIPNRFRYYCRTDGPLPAVEMGRQEIFYPPKLIRQQLVQDSNNCKADLLHKKLPIPDYMHELPEPPTLVWFDVQKGSTERRYLSLYELLACSHKRL